MNKLPLDLLAIGDCSIDLYMKVDAKGVTTDTSTPQPKICFYHGSKVQVDAFRSSIAGNACHVSVGCKLLGLNVATYTELGDDSNADLFIKDFKDYGVLTDYCVKNPNSPTNVHAVIVYGDDRTIFTYHEKRNYKLYDWPKPKWIFYSSLAKGFENFQKELVAYLKKNPDIGVAFNPGTLQINAGLDDLKDILNVTDVLFVNKEEAEMILSKTFPTLEETHKALHALGPKLTLITDGKKGSSAYDGANFIYQGIPGDGSGVVDKTGAGDAYTAGVISALFYGKSLKTAMTWGMINSASVVKVIGGVHGLKTLKEIEEAAKTLKSN